MWPKKFLLGNWQVNYLVTNNFISLSIILFSGQFLSIICNWADYGQLWSIIGSSSLFKFFFSKSWCIFGDFFQLYVNSWVIFEKKKKSQCFIMDLLSFQWFTQLLLEVNCQVNNFLNYYMKWLGRARFWVKSRSKPRLRGWGSVKGLDYL